MDGGLFSEWRLRARRTAPEHWRNLIFPLESSCPCGLKAATVKARDTVSKEKQIKEKIAKFANVPMDCLEIDILERR